jgi:predicted esterase
MTADPHAGQPVLHAGASLQVARLAMIMVHGRGASAHDMIGLSQEFSEPEVAYLAPQAARSTWYPFSFLSPIAQNEPGITSGLNVLARLLQSLERDGLTADRVVLLGFSQGACLALEFAARFARRFGGVIGLSGGLIGPEVTERNDGGTLAETPVFLGCSDRDPHIPLARVHETASVFRRLGAAVDERIYPAMGHTVNEDEIQAVRALLGPERRPAHT